MNSILVAGIGNIFFGDDAFGVETITALRQDELPEGVKAVDFGIRSYDLAYALADGHDAVILVDAAPRQRPPGTVSLIEPDLREMEHLATEAVNAHSMNPVSVLQMAHALGGRVGPLYLVGCEPADLGGDEGRMGLSEEARAAVPVAVGMIRKLIGRLKAEGSPNGAPGAKERV